MKIFYRKKETKNLGNYENLSVEIGIEDEVNFEIETSEDCFLRLKNFTNEKLKEQFDLPSVTIEQVQTAVKNLITQSPTNRKTIKDLLHTYNVTKFKELTPLQLKQCNEKLKLLRGNHE